eukprot:XP_011451605.1 PREDICTED: uncharacterized protein LOC105345225 [Crassostrea gigas]
MEASKFLLSGLLLTVCALIFQLVGLASPNWITTYVQGVKIQIGLWKLCAKVRKRNWCLEDKDVRDFLEPVRATAIVGFISLLFALVLIILKIFVMKDKKNILFVAIGSTFVGAFFILVSIADFARKIDDDFNSDGEELDYDFSFAFALCIIAMLSSLSAGAVMIADAVKTG